MPKCKIVGCEKNTRNKNTTVLYCPMHLARIERYGYPELKKDPCRSLEKLPHDIVDGFIKEHCSVMKDDDMVKALRSLGFAGANNWTVKYRRRKLGFKKYLSGDILKHRVWIRMQAIKKYGSACELCGYHLTVDTHHVVPKYKGGPHEVENLMVLCPNCHALITRKQVIINDRRDIPQVKKLIVRKMRNI